MKVHTEYLWFETRSGKELVLITPQLMKSLSEAA